MKPSAVLLATVLALVAVEISPSTASAADQLPDLAMADPTDIHIQSTTDGRRLLRYTSVILNVGSGPFEVIGARESTAQSEMSTAQRVHDGNGSYRAIDTPAKMFFAGDGHNHWHVRDLESGDLVRPDNGTKVGTSAKRGFCFFDNVAQDLNLPGAPQTPVYTGCGGSGSLSVKMGLSVGWGDRYAYNLAYQYIDITGLDPGRYELISTADASNWFAESDESNNQSSLEIQITGAPAPVTAFPVAARLYAGTVRSGDSGDLAADDGSFFQVNSSSGRTHWYSRFSDIPNGLKNLRINYSGKASLATTQKLRIWDYKTRAWVTLNTRTVGSSEIAIAASPSGDLSRYVSGGTGNGDVLVAVRSTRSDSKRFVASADLLTAVYDAP